jgi:hypothetical protein
MRTPKNPYIFNPKTDKVVWRNPTPVEVTKRRIGQYFGDDPAKFLHSSKTHRTASEAFRDADYACALWRCETEWDRTKQYIGWGLMWVVTLGVLYLLATWFNEVTR